MGKRDRDFSQRPKIKTLFGGFDNHTFKELDKIKIYDGPNERDNLWRLFGSNERYT